MAALRKTPTSTNGGSGVGTTYTAAVDTEIEALWASVAGFLTSVAGTNTITAASDSALVTTIAAYARPMAFYFKPANTNTTTTVTINIDGVGAVAIKDKDGNALAAGALVAARIHLIIWDGTQFLLFTTSPPTNAPTPAPDIILQEQQTQNTTAGGFTAATWVTRALNTVVRNVVSGASLASNVLTLPAGTYCVEWSAPAADVGTHLSRLFNVSDSAVIGYSGNEFCGSGAGSRSVQKVVFTISVSKNVRLEHICTTTNGTNGLGVASNITTEIYSWMNVYKVA